MRINYVLSDGNYYIDDEWDYRCKEYKTNDVNKATKFETQIEAIDYLNTYKDICNLKEFSIYKTTCIVEICS
jgi:hypothetical protein